MKKIILILVMVVMLFQTIFIETARAEDIGVDKGNYEKIEGELKLIPKDITMEEAVDNGFVVEVQGRLKSDPRLMEEFYKKTKVGKTAEVKILRYTIEGEPSITILKYDGEKFYGVEDTTRHYSGGKTYDRFSYRFLKEFKGDNDIHYYLFNKDYITYDQYKKSILSNDPNKFIDGRPIVGYYQ